MDLKEFNIFIDNATIAGAGRAFYNSEVEHFDTISLGHFVTSVLLSDNIHIDGSSRLRPMPTYAGNTPPLAAIWTWERQYPVFNKITLLKDNFLGSYRSISPYVLEYIFRTLAKDTLFPEKEILNIIPSAYKSRDYFDLEFLELFRKKTERETKTLITDDIFLFALYAWRGIHYHELAKREGITYFPNPHRVKFIERLSIPGDLISRIYEADNQKSLEILTKIITTPRYNLLKKLELENCKDFELDVPPFLNYILSKSKSRTDVVNNIIELKNSKAIIKLRKWLYNYNEAYRHGNLLDLKKLSQEINGLTKKLEKNLGLERREPLMKITPKLPIDALNVNLSTQLDIKIPKKLYSNIFNKSYQKLIWRVSKSILMDNTPTKVLNSMEPITNSETDGVESVFMGNGTELSKEDGFYDDRRRLNFWENILDKDEPIETVRVRGWSDNENFELSNRPFNKE